MIRPSLQFSEEEKILLRDKRLYKLFKKKFPQIIMTFEWYQQKQKEWNDFIEWKKLKENQLIFRESNFDPVPQNILLSELARQRDNLKS